MGTSDRDTFIGQMNTLSTITRNRSGRSSFPSASVMRGESWLAELTVSMTSIPSNRC
jgi:hypothetical protein